MSKKPTKSAEEIAAEASKKEMEVKRDEITAYYKESIIHLKTQLEYETILKDIEAARAERIQAQTFIANAMATQQEQATNTSQPVDLQKGVSNAEADWDAQGDKAPPVMSAPRKLKSV